MVIALKCFALLFTAALMLLVEPGGDVFPETSNCRRLLCGDFSFESVPVGEYQSLSMSRGTLEVEIYRTSGMPFTVIALDDSMEWPEGWEDKALSPGHAANPTLDAQPEDAFVLNFSLPVQGVGIKTTNFGGVSRLPTLSCYAELDGLGTVIARGGVIWAAGMASPSFGVLTVIRSEFSPRIRSCTFTGDTVYPGHPHDGDNPNGMFFDVIGINRFSLRPLESAEELGSKSGRERRPHKGD